MEPIDYYRISVDCLNGLPLSMEQFIATQKRIKAAIDATFAAQSKGRLLPIDFEDLAALIEQSTKLDGAEAEELADRILDRIDETRPGHNGYKAS